MNKEGKRLRCPNCGHEWTYRGSRNVYATCPDCKTSVKIEKHEVTDHADD